MRARRPLPAALLAALALACGARADDAAPRRPAHVVLVILGGGVRAREMLDAGLMPSVVAIAGRGVAVDRVRSGARSPWVASLRLLTGRDDVPDAPGRPRPPHPTLMERTRQGLSLPAEKVWFVSCAGGDDLRLAASEDPAFGPAAAPAVAHGEGAYAEPLAGLLATWGRPLPTEERAWTLLRALRGRNREAVGAWLPDAVDAGLAESERVEAALLGELDRRALLERGPFPADERALRAAATVLAVHRPTLTVVRLGGGVQAQAGVERYRAALREADAGIGRLRAVVESDPVLRDRTSLWVVGDMGRNAAPDASGALASDDDSADRLEVALVAEGPGIRRGASVPGPRTLASVAPTLERLLGLPEAPGSGRALESLLDPALRSR